MDQNLQRKISTNSNYNVTQCNSDDFTSRLRQKIVRDENTGDLKSSGKAVYAAHRWLEHDASGGVAYRTLCRLTRCLHLCRAMMYISAGWCLANNSETTARQDSGGQGGRGLAIIRQRAAAESLKNSSAAPASLKFSGRKKAQCRTGIPARFHPAPVFDTNRDPRQIGREQSRIPL